MLKNIFSIYFSPIYMYYTPRQTTPKLQIAKMAFFENVILYLLYVHYYKGSGVNLCEKLYGSVKKCWHLWICPVQALTLQKRLFCIFATPDGAE